MWTFLSNLRKQVSRYFSDIFEIRNCAGDSMAFDRAGLERRTREFAVRVVRFVASLPRGPIGDVLGRQLLRAATSIGANYREACRAESRSDFVHKIGLVEKEAAETQYWLELCGAAGVGSANEVNDLLKEATELLAIFTQIGKSTKAVTTKVRNSKFEIRK
jgi:four helix bundle protein